MRRLFFSLFLTALCFPAASQAQTFTFGGRYSNYSTDVTAGPLAFDTGRESGWGLVGEYRNQWLVVRGNYDSDTSGGLSPVPLIDFSDYERSRFEATVGYAAIPMLDLEAGVRTDSISFGGIFSDDLSIDHQALVAGATIHSTGKRPAGFYVSGRGYFGTADLELNGLKTSPETTGYRVEAGIPISLGESAWELVPGVSYERLEGEDDTLDLKSNRFFLNFTYTFGK